MKYRAYWDKWSRKSLSHFKFCTRFYFYAVTCMDRLRSKEKHKGTGLGFLDTVAYIFFGLIAIPRFQGCCKQVQAELVSNSNLAEPCRMCATPTHASLHIRVNNNNNNNTLASTPTVPNQACPAHGSIQRTVCISGATLSFLVSLIN